MNRTENRNSIGKLQVALYTRGTGIILFALWSFLRVFILSFGSDAATGDAVEFTRFGMLIADFIVGGIDSALRVYVGRSAILLSRGKKLRRFSLVLAGILAVIPLLFYSLYFSVSGFSALSLSIIISCATDIAVFILNIQIIVYSLRLVRAEA